MKLQSGDLLAVPSFIYGLTTLIVLVLYWDDSVPGLDVHGSDRLKVEHCLTVYWSFFLGFWFLRNRLPFEASFFWGILAMFSGLISVTMGFTVLRDGGLRVSAPLYIMTYIQLGVPACIIGGCITSTILYGIFWDGCRWKRSTSSVVVHPQRQTFENVGTQTEMGDDVKVDIAS